MEIYSVYSGSQDQQILTAGGCPTVPHPPPGARYAMDTFLVPWHHWCTAHHAMDISVLFAFHTVNERVGTELKPYTSFTWILNYRSSVAQQSVVSLGGVPPGAQRSPQSPLRSLAVTLPTCWVRHCSPRILPCRFSSIFSSQQIRSMVLKKWPRSKPGSLTADLIEFTMKRSSSPFLNVW